LSEGLKLWIKRAEILAQRLIERLQFLHGAGQSLGA
jgi:hypothetical protein